MFPKSTYPEVLINLISEADAVSCDLDRNTIIEPPMYLAQRCNLDTFNHKKKKKKECKSFLTYKDCKANIYLRKEKHYSSKSRFFV